MNNAKIKRMAGIALLIALVIVLQLLGGMIPPVGGFSISLVLIPIVLGAAVYGPKAGALLGAAFGVIVTINCITGADGGGAMVFQANPLLCVAVVMGKGILAGFFAGLVYRLISHWNGYAAMVAAAVVCPVINTGVFVLCMLTFFRDVLTVWASPFGGDVIVYVFSGLLVFNFIPELIINVLFSPFGQRIVHTILKK